VETIAAYGISNFPVEMLQGCTIFHNKVTEFLCQEMGLTLILPMWRIWWTPNNVSKWQMGFNLAFKGL